MDKPTDNTTGGALQGQHQGLPISRLATYARHMVRAYLAAMSAEEPAANDPWRGFRIPAERIARQFRESFPEILNQDAADIHAELKKNLTEWLTNPPADFYGLAELTALFKLTPEDIEIFILAAAPAVDPSITELYTFVWNNVQIKCADVGFICQILSMNRQDEFERYKSRCSFDGPLRKHRLVLVEPRQNRDDGLDLNLTGRRIRAADRVLEFLRQTDPDAVPPVDEALAATCLRIREDVQLSDLRLEDFTHDAILQLARSRNLPAIFEGPRGSGMQMAAQALATLYGRGVVVADLTALVTLPSAVLDVRLNELLREARLGGDLLFFQGHELPEFLAGSTQMLLQQLLGEEELILAVDKTPVWAVNITQGWPVITIPLPGVEHRVQLWIAAFKDDRRAPSEDALETVARRYEMSPEQISQAAAEARRLTMLGRRKHIGLTDLDRSCRSHFAHQLSELATIIPPAAFKPEHLILPQKEKEVFDEILLYSKHHDAIYSDWGFAEKFPYGRGLSVLFYGPPGTGKTMAACIIATVLGLDLYRVDISRIMSRYVGETEKNLSRVFDQAERGRAMLLFDEADALFTKRTSVKSSNDRYANLEVAYLLQRMENFEGVTVLTTNEEGNLDDAFKRRIRYRVYFPMPDGETRGRLWASLIPEQAPARKDIPFGLIGENFEISGGHIKQAVLRAAFYAKRADSEISLEHLVEAGLTECRELGMLMSDKLPKSLAKAVRAERGEPEPEDFEEVVLPLLPGPR